MNVEDLKPDKVSLFCPLDIRCKCYEQYCACWDEDAQCCAVLTIAKSLRKLARK